MKLPLFLKPIYSSDLIRVGKLNDGGYIVSKNSILDANYLVSFGLNDDWSFEKNFSELNNQAPILVFDAQVTTFFWLKRFLKDTIYLVKKEIKIRVYLINLLTFFKYKKFFSKKDITHFKKNITPNNLKNISKLKSSTSIIKLLTNQNIEKEFLLKIDIEGNEYAILEDIIKVQSKLTGLVLEFHNCFIMREHIQNFLNKINLDLVHIHVNNYGEVTKDDFPNVIEMTFSKRIYNYLRKKDEFKFPNNLLDSPNNPKFEDKEITFEQ